MNEKAGRNDVCPCGSGKKYKNCCLNKPTVSEKLKKGKIKAKWLNQPEGPNLMERMFGHSIELTGKNYEPPQPSNEEMKGNQ